METDRPEQSPHMKMKMYILVKESIPIGFALVAVAHASLAAYLKFQAAPEVATWLAGPFYKTIGKVSDQEFDKAKLFPDSVVITESALEGQEVALAFKPREEWPKAFKYYKLYR
jgi:peptidyl-tRNA hydrolase